MSRLQLLKFIVFIFGSISSNATEMSEFSNWEDPSGIVDITSSGAIIIIGRHNSSLQSQLTGREPNPPELGCVCHKLRCFSRDTIVHLADQEVSVGSLQEGQFVLDASGKWTKFLGHIHSGDEQTEFVKIRLSSGEELLLTKEHLIFSKGSPKYAGDVVTGDWIDGVKHSTSQTVVQVKTTNQSGFYAPLTESGTIAVGHGKLKASCYAGIRPWFHGVVRFYQYLFSPTLEDFKCWAKNIGYF